MDKNYTTYSAVEFAEEPSFIRWVLGRDTEDSQFWEQWVVDNPDSLTEVEEAKKLISVLRVHEQEPENDEISALWNRIKTTIDQSEEPKQAVRRRLYIGLTAAAAIILLLVIFLLPASGSVVATQNAQYATEILPDQSIVRINADSRIEYDESEWDNARLVKLVGEAFFEVQAAEIPFVVVTEHGSVEVLGTSFNVYDRADGFYTDCLTGKVRVRNAAKTEDVILTPGQKSSLIDMDGKFLTGEVALDKVASWREGILHFDGANLSHVFEEIERQFDVKVNYGKEIGENQYTGFFDTANLDSALYSVCWPMRLEAITSGRRVTIQPTQ